MEAGWFADPSGAFELRYYDGFAWTEHVANSGVQARSPLPESFAKAPPLPARSQARPRQQGVFTHGLGGKELSSTRQQLNVLLLVVVLVVVLGSCAGFASGW